MSIEEALNNHAAAMRELAQSLAGAANSIMSSEATANRLAAELPEPEKKGGRGKKKDKEEAVADTAPQANAPAVTPSPVGGASPGATAPAFDPQQDPMYAELANVTTKAAALAEPEMQSLVASYGVTRVSTLPRDKWPEYIERVKQLIASKEAPQPAAKANFI